VCVYVPNGQAVGSEAWEYKLAWLARLRKHMGEHYGGGEPVALCGDTNVAVDDLDIDRPDEWVGSVISHPEVREGLKGLIHWGLVDVFRQKHPEGKVYSFWDYRNLDFPLNNGLRIDHILATAPLAARCLSATIDRDERKGDKPSDHAPVVAVFQD
jgi:exodeoxyribonuclease-3